MSYIYRLERADSVVETDDGALSARMMEAGKWHGAYGDRLWRAVAAAANRYALEKLAFGAPLPAIRWSPDLDPYWSGSPFLARVTPAQLRGSWEPWPTT